jgi:exopolysaccharide biosynthesis polyprenyl glycosylphosphotransferase
MLKRFSSKFALFSLMLDLSLIAGALALAEYLRGALPYGKPFVRAAYIPGVLYGVVVLIWLIVSLALSVYDPKRTYKAVDEFQNVIAANAFASLLFAGFLYLSFREVSRLLFVYYALLSALGLLAWRVLARILFRLSDGRNFAERRVLVVGAGELGHRIAATIREYHWTGLTLVGYLDDDPRKGNNGLPLLGTLDDVRRVVRRHRIDELVVALPQRAHERLNKLIADLQEVPVNIRVVPDYFSLAVFRATVDDFGGLPLISLREPVLNPYQRMVKRTLDLALGSVALLFAAPVMLLIAAIIRLDSRGAAIFRQQRVGENGRLFWMLKFRSMVDGAEEQLDQVVETTPDGHIVHKRPDDPRVTRVGRFLRSSSLDELPQLFNVLKGEMSLVGPRPELPWVVAQYEPWQRKRFAVPQGMTGWWQVNGRSDKLMHEHTEEDLYYIQNYSLLLDVQILWKTLGAVIKRSGAY